MSEYSNAVFDPRPPDDRLVHAPHRNGPRTRLFGYLLLIHTNLTSEGAGPGLPPTFTSLSFPLTYSPLPPLKAFDLFLVDDRILPLLGKALGKTFFSKKKHPVALKLGGLLSSNPQAMATVGKRIIAAQQRAHLYRNHGNCLSVKVAKTSFKPAEAVANVLAGIEAAVEATPGKWKNVMAISVKTSSSVALPLYQRLPQYLIKKPGALGIGQAVHAQLEGDEPGEEGDEGKGKVPC